jgi:hypothetical protein
MRSITLTICFLIVSCLIKTNAVSAQEQSQCIALITGFKGNVMVKKGNKPDFAKVLWGTQLFTGDQVKTDANSEATITFSDGNILKLAPSRNFTVSGNLSGTQQAENVKKVSSAMMINMSALTSGRETKKDVGALAGLRATDKVETIELTSPSNTLIRTNQPTFTWTPKKEYDKFIVNLYSSKGLVWSRKVDKSPMSFPETEKSLDFGETYFWNVEGEDLLENEKSSNYRFSVLSIDKSKEVLDQESSIRKTFDSDADSSSLHSFLGAYYINQGLLQDAINEFQIVSRINPDAPLPHEIIGSLYSDIGNKDMAIEELQKALKLSKVEEK